MTDAAPSRTPAAQTIALVILGFGSFEILTLIICLAVFKRLDEPTLLLLSSLATGITSIIALIAGFYFGSSLGSAQKAQTIASIAAPKDPQP